MTDESLNAVYMHTSNGKRYYPFNPAPEDVDINVVAHHLANNGRWAGATQHKVYDDRIFFSVAEHSVLVADYVEHEITDEELEPHYQVFLKANILHQTFETSLEDFRNLLILAALLHDAPEAFIGDLIRPLKYSPVFHKPFKVIEDINEAAVDARFNLYGMMSHPIVKIADEAVCHAEWLQIVPRNPDVEWEPGFHDGSRRANIEIQMLDPYSAKLLFIGRYKLLRAVSPSELVAA